MHIAALSFCNLVISLAIVIDYKLASKVSTSPNTSYIEFILGATAVTQSQELSNAASHILLEVNVHVQVVYQHPLAN